MCQFSGPGPGEYKEYRRDAFYWHGDGILWSFGDDNATWSGKSSEGQEVIKVLNDILEFI